MNTFLLVLLGCGELPEPNPPVLKIVHEDEIKDLEYPVKGATAKEAHAAMIEMSKIMGLASRSRQRWNYTWTKTTRFYHSQCHLEDVVLTTDMFSRMPAWTDSEKASAKDQAWWEKEQTRMQTYRDWHRAQSVEARVVWEQELRALPPQDSCEELLEKAEEIFQALFTRRRAVPNPPASTPGAAK